MNPSTDQSTGVNRNIILAVTILSNFINPMMGAAVNVALPRIGVEFDLGAVGQAWVTTAYLLTAAVFLIPFGKVGDMMGRKKVFFWGNIAFMGATFLCAFSVNDVMLIASRLLQGIGGAMVQSTSIALIMLAFPPQERGKAIGYSVAATYLGLSCAPVIGGLLTQSLGWRSLFLVNGVIGIVISLVVLFKIKAEWVEKTSEKFDITGSLILLVGISALMVGFSKLPNLINIILTVIGLAGVTGFIVYESRISHPVLNVKLFSENRTFSMANLTALINYSATFAVTFVMSLYLQNVKGYEPRDAGIILISQPIMMAAVAIFSGRWSDKRDPRKLASAGMAIIVVGLFMLTFLHQETHLSYIIASLLILGSGFGLFSSPNTNSAMSAVDRKFYGVASATLSTMRSMGMMMSMALATMVTFLFVGNEHIGPATMPAYLQSVRIIFGIFTLLCFIGIFTSLTGRKKQ